MLRQILDAHGGQLPNDVIAVFQNTGLEHPATYQFLKDIADHWCPITWLEYVRTEKNTYRIVTFDTASRNGEPFDALITSRKMLPNPIARFCTVEMKIRTGNRFAKDQGWDEWTRVVGLRYDEPRRVHRIKGDISAETVVCPMHDAKHTNEDVLDFWNKQPFDLNLPGNDNSFGNCVGCFLKGRSKLEKIGRSRPENLEWWARQEERTDFNAGRGGTFRADRPTYRQILTRISVEGRLFDDNIDDETIPCMCTE